MRGKSVKKHKIHEPDEITQEHDPQTDEEKKRIKERIYEHYEEFENEVKIYVDKGIRPQTYFRFKKNPFENKTVLTPCDDPHWSNFFRFFVLNFNRLKIKRLISTCYAGPSELIPDPQETFKGRKAYKADIEFVPSYLDSNKRISFWEMNKVLLLCIELIKKRRLSNNTDLIKPHDIAYE